MFLFSVMSFALLVYSYRIVYIYTNCTNHCSYFYWGFFTFTSQPWETRGCDTSTIFRSSLTALLTSIWTGFVALGDLTYTLCTTWSNSNLHALQTMCPTLYLVIDNRRSNSGEHSLLKKIFVSVSALFARISASLCVAYTFSCGLSLPGSRY